MKRTRSVIFIICLALLVFSFATPVRSGTLYRCVNSKGSVMMTDNPPTDPDFKCTFGASSRDRTPQERAKAQREADAYRQQNEAAKYNRARLDAQAQQNSKKIEMERMRLQAEIEQEEKAISEIRRSRQSEAQWGISFREDRIKRIKEDLNLLKSDQEQYYYQKNESDKSAPIIVEGYRDTRSPSDFLPKAGKYRWQVE